MSKVAIQGNASGTGTFTIQSPATNTDRTLTLPDEAGTVLTSASDIQSQALSAIPLCDAYISALTFDVSNATTTKLAFDQARTSSDSSMLDGTNYRITAPLDGYYNVQVVATVDDFGSTLERSSLYLYKNGVNYGTLSDIHTVSVHGKNQTTSTSILIPLDANDYVEIYGRLTNDGSSQLRFYGQPNQISAFQVTFVRPL